MADERWFTVRQIAELLQADEQTIRRWLKAGRIVGRNFGGKVGWRVRESDLNAFLLDRGEGRGGTDDRDEDSSPLCSGIE